MRVKRLRREAAAYVIMRRKGQSINNISAVFGRSTSFVSRIIKANEGLILTRFDLRKLPRICKLRAASRMFQTLLKLQIRWENWILGNGEKPP